jgi:hypothetical protein
MYARAIERIGPTATLLEWDDNIPTFDEVHAEALKANRHQPEGNAGARHPLMEEREEMKA